MSREIRKANLRKLQLPGTGRSDCNLRRTRSAAAAVTTTISSYFSDSPEAHVPPLPDEQSNSPLAQQPNSRKQQPADENTNAATGAFKSSASNKTRNAKRTKLTAFVFKDSKNAPTQLQGANAQPPSDDFETPQKKIKKAPNLRRTNTTKMVKSQASKRQPSVKSAFLRNELLFSELTAQHCVAEHFNPDEVQLALAISKSEAESSGALCLSAGEEEVVVDLVHGKKYRTEGHQTSQNVRDKLKMYGFRTAAREDYNCLAAAFLPGVNRRTKCKWASKFTVLTLRNPDVQRKKVDARIEEFLKQQLRTIPLSAAKNRMEAYAFMSTVLRQCEEQQQAARVLKREDEELLALPLAGYFVQELFAVAHLPAGHLLKDWSAIPGRDLSPKPQSKECRMKEAKLRAVYAELEDHFGGGQGNLGFEKENLVVCALETDSTVAAWESNVELEKLVELIDELPQSAQNLAAISGHESVHSHSNTKVAIASSVSPKREPPEKKIKMPSNSGIDSSGSATHSTPQCSAIQSSTRATSPDIFADSDKEMDETVNADRSATVEQESANNSSALSQHGIAINESYCSEGGIEINAEDPEQIVDLTQDEGETSDVPLGSQSSTTPDRVDTIADHNSLRIEDANSQQSSAERRLSQDAEIAAAVRDFGREEHTVASSKFLNRCEVSDEQFSRLLGKYMEPDKSIIQHPRCSVPVQLNEPPLKNTVRKRLSKERSWNCATQAVQTENWTCLKRSKSTLLTSNADQCDTAVRDATETEVSVDLTQSDVSDSTDNCIVLSDDEINYSIWRADKSANIRLGKKKTSEESDALDFSISDLIDKDEFTSFSIAAQEGRIKQQLSPAAQATSLFHASWNSGDREPIAGEFLTTRQNSNDCMNMSRTPKAHDRSRELAEFGILENFSESFVETPPSLQTPSKSATDRLRYSVDDGSFLGSPSENAAFMRRCRSGSGQKLSALLQEIPTSTNNVNCVTASVANDDVFDEFDKLIYGSPKRTPTPKRQKVPVGLEQLLTAEISFQNDRLGEIAGSGEECQKAATSFTSPCLHEYEIDGRKYKARMVVTPKPDFTQQTEAELLKQLYAFGIKPLKRKQAVKMLEYIYNQTHPIMLEEATKESPQIKVPAMKVSPQNISESDYNLGRSQTQSQTQHLSGTQTGASGTAAIQMELQLQDCGGDVLLRFAHELSTEQEDEQYIFQTNISKKLSQALLPLHVAWYNLVCSSTALHEMVLHFEPIDLQQIYLFFKQLGFRYEPKDLKRFFDNRCIIFRYDLTPPGKQAGRHTRKTTRSKKAVGNKRQKCR